MKIALLVIEGSSAEMASKMQVSSLEKFNVKSLISLGQFFLQPSQFFFIASEALYRQGPHHAPFAGDSVKVIGLYTGMQPNDQICWNALPQEILSSIINLRRSPELASLRPIYMEPDVAFSFTSRQQSYSTMQATKCINKNIFSLPWGQRDHSSLRPWDHSWIRCPPHHSSTRPFLSTSLSK